MTILDTKGAFVTEKFRFGEVAKLCSLGISAACKGVDLIGRYFSSLLSSLDWKSRALLGAKCAQTNKISPND